MYKMLCLDIDGTLVNSKQQIPEANKKAILELNKLGIPVILVSARPAIGMRGLIAELKIGSNPVIAFGGAFVVHNDKNLLRNIIDAENAISILKVVKNMGCDHITVFNGDRWAVRAIDEVTQFEMKLLGISPEFVGDIDNIVKNVFIDGVDKFLLSGHHEELVVLKKKLEDKKIPIEAIFSKPHYLEIHPKGISKASAVAKAADVLGILQKEVVACGDNFNDLTMIEWAGLGVAMGNAPLEVKKRADYVTLTNDNCGVAQVIEKFFLSDLVAVNKNGG